MHKMRLRGCILAILPHITNQKSLQHLWQCSAVGGLQAAEIRPCWGSVSRGHGNLQLPRGKMAISHSREKGWQWHPPWPLTAALCWDMGAPASSTCSHNWAQQPFLFTAATPSRAQGPSQCSLCSPPEIPQRANHTQGSEQPKLSSFIQAHQCKHTLRLSQKTDDLS